jgi:hypothetical protein
VVKRPLLPLPSTVATIDDAAIGAVSSLPPLLPPLTMTNIVAVNGFHCRCHIVNDNNCQKPAVIVYCQRRQWQSLLMEAAVDGGCSNFGLCQWQLLLMEAQWDGGMMVQWHPR